MKRLWFLYNQHRTDKLSCEKNAHTLPQPCINSWIDLTERPQAFQLCDIQIASREHPHLGPHAPPPALSAGSVVFPDCIIKDVII